jgi:hypothetical protein
MTDAPRGRALDTKINLSYGSEKRFRSMIPSRTYSGFLPDMMALPEKPMEEASDMSPAECAVSISLRQIRAQTLSTTSVKIFSP